MMSPYAIVFHDPIHSLKNQNWLVNSFYVLVIKLRTKLLVVDSTLVGQEPAPNICHKCYYKMMIPPTSIRCRSNLSPKWVKLISKYGFLNQQPKNKTTTSKQYIYRNQCWKWTMCAAREWWCHPLLLWSERVQSTPQHMTKVDWQI